MWNRFTNKYKHPSKPFLHIRRIFSSRVFHRSGSLRVQSSGSPHVPKRNLPLQTAPSPPCCCYGNIRCDFDIRGKHSHGSGNVMCRGEPDICWERKGTLSSGGQFWTGIDITKVCDGPSFCTCYYHQRNYPSLYHHHCVLNGAKRASAHVIHPAGFLLSKPGLLRLCEPVVLPRRVQRSFAPIYQAPSLSRDHYTNTQQPETLTTDHSY